MDSYSRACTCAHVNGVLWTHPRVHVQQDSIGLELAAGILVAGIFGFTTSRAMYDAD